jgi:hypothetical protein
VEQKSKGIELKKERVRSNEAEEQGAITMVNENDKLESVQFDDSDEFKKLN